MVQLGTILHQEGPAAFARITKELKAIMEEKGYETLEDFRGKIEIYQLIKNKRARTCCPHSF